MSTIEPQLYFYIRHCLLMIARGENPSLPIEPETPSNVVDIRAARTMRAVRLLMQGHNSFRERPL